MYSNDFILNIMERAIELSKKGRGMVSPNPLVGCVIVKNNKIIGEGFHEKYGGNHAEKNAIDNCIEDPLGSAAFITLEPCCIDSKTPPCTDLLIDNGIDRVYVGIKDPNPDINGKGIEVLERNGIKVESGFLASNISKLNKGFFKWVQKGTPWITAKIAQGVDGSMGMDNETQTWITGEESRKNSHYLRSKVDAVLIGSQTAKVDNPSLTVREVPGRNPKRVVLDTNRTSPIELKIYSDNEAETIIMCSNEKFEKNKALNCRFIPVKETNGELDLEDVILKLANDGVTSLLIESGPKLIKSFYDYNLIDELYLYTADIDFPDSRLKNPININNDWVLKNTQILGGDELQVFERKELCLQE